jgi:hypothetical protein
VSANGAPALKESRDDEIILFCHLKKNLPKLQSSLFTTPQAISIRRASIYVCNKQNDAPRILTRGSKHGSLSDDLLTQFKTILQSSSAIDYSPTM